MLKKRKDWKKKTKIKKSYIEERKVSSICKFEKTCRDDNLFFINLSLIQINDFLYKEKV